ncbi:MULTISPECIES: hypothetical protein [Sphingobacterium]|uniref:AbiTii domain-containing protein n=1 Tax=Sphingobacterium TaxID=28453 RepID=UPI0025806E84|nr:MULTISPECIES: hypothetical protein [Sphingobacterium]
MIKELIEDLTFEKISLTSALTRAKIIAFKTSNTNFKEWLQQEINGYTDGLLPDYRIINCEIYLEVYDSYRGSMTIPCDVSKLEEGLNSEISFYKLRIKQSISTLEVNAMDAGSNAFGYELAPQSLVTALDDLADIDYQIIAVKRRFQITDMKRILELTKQKLLDTLLELNDAFPDFENTFSRNQRDNEQRVQNIINQNIYGNNANSNIGIGDTIEQTLTSSYSLDQLSDELKRIGVEETDIVELKELIKIEPKDSLGKKILGWVGKIAAKAVEKGVELQVPLLIETVKNYI